MHFLYIRLLYWLLIKELLVITRQWESLESLSVLDGKRLIAQHPLKIEIAGWIWMRGYRSTSSICRGFRGVYFVYDPIFERIRKLDRWRSVLSLFFFFLYRNCARIDINVSASDQTTTHCDDIHLHANGNVLTAFFSLLLLIVIPLFFLSSPGAVYLRAVLQRDRKIIGAHNSRR